MADIPLSNALASAGQRRATYVLTASDASFPIPSWAQGGKGIVYVTGCGGGGGGQAATNGGNAAASAIRHPLMIPSGATTIGATVGAAGPANTAGGNSEISIGGTNVLRLEGGLAGGATASLPAFWDAAASAWRQQSPLGSTFNVSLLHSLASWTLQRGLTNNGANGGSSPFGAGGISSGQAAAGYGSGGSINAAGTPGFFFLEFVEGV